MIDVRRFPKSSRFPHFNQEPLAGALAKEGLDYCYLGEELGGYRSGGYEAYRRGKTYEVGLSLLCQQAGAKVSAIVCAERLPWRCHRWYLAQDLFSKGWRVIHIIDKGRLWEPSGGGTRGDNEKGLEICFP